MDILIVFLLFIVFVIAVSLLNSWLTRRAIEKSGKEGEELTRNKLGTIPGIYKVIHNLNLNHHGRPGEGDHLLILPDKGLVLVETKHHHGAILVSNEKEWVQQKVSQRGRGYLQEPKYFRSPVAQIRRTMGILKSVLRDSGNRVWIYPVVVFSNSLVSLKDGGYDGDIPVVMLEHLESAINKLPKRENPLSIKIMDKIVNSLEGHANGIKG